MIPDDNKVSVLIQNDYFSTIPIISWIIKNQEVYSNFVLITSLISVLIEKLEKHKELILKLYIPDGILKWGDKAMLEQTNKLIEELEELKECLNKRFY